MKDAAYIMSRAGRSAQWSAAVCIAAVALGARAQAPADHIVTKVSAEVLARPHDPSPAQNAAGASGSKLEPAERVVPGDVLIYTVEVRNVGQYAVESAVVIQKVPAHTVYLADSAVGPGVDVEYSIDGGRSFDSAQRHKSPPEYTHIRWRLHNRLKPGSVAYVRFRAQVK